jgi:glycosidase
MNVANEENDVNSPLNFTRELNNLIQKNVVFQDGNIQFDLYNDSTHIIAYTLNNGRQSFKVYCNFDTNVQPLNYDHNKVLLANYSNNLNGLQPYQFLILQN